MAASSKLMIIEAERRFPCRIKLAFRSAALANALQKCTLGSTRIAAPMAG
jgi:hypothetical protein